MGLILDPDYLAAQRALAQKTRAETGQLPHNYFWNTLREKYALNPERFTHYHPLVGKWIAEEIHSIPPTCHIVCPTPPSPPIHVVPEPASISLLATALLAVAWRFYVRHS